MQLDPGQTVIFVTTVIGFATTVLIQGIQLYREHRNRKWDVADRESARLAAIERANAIAEKVEVVNKQTVEAHNVVVSKLDENAVRTEKAFTEANNVNLKFYTLASAFNASYDRKAAGLREREEDFEALRKEAENNLAKP